MNVFLEDIDNEYYEIDIIEEEDDSDDDVICKNFYECIKAELSLKEFNRKTFTFKYKDETVKGKPIYEINKTNIIFEIDNKLKKINLDLVELE